MAVEESRKRTEAGTEVARMAFLHGNGDGVPVTSTARLSELGGISEKTIHRHMPAWIKEREEMLATVGNSAFGLSLSSETIEQHRKNTEFLKEQHDSLAAEIRLLPKLHEFLEKVLEEFVNSEGEKDYEQALRIFNAYCRTGANLKALQTQFVAIQRAWKENAGIDSLQDVATAREKTLATGRAKLDLKREEGGDGPKPAGGREVQPSRDGVFDLGQSAPEVDEVEECG